MFKNVASQKLIVYAFDSTTNLPKTGDAANLTAYVSKDYGTVTVLGDTSATEMDSTNGKGYYLFDLTQGETNGDCLMFSCKSSTSNIVVIAVPAVVFTVPPYFSTLGIASDGDLVKVNTLDGHTAQTGDVYARVGAPAGASVSADIAAVKSQTAAIETDTQDIQSRIPAALVSGRIDASVGAMAANVLTATAINADAITAAKVAADVTTEIQSGLATASALSTLEGKVDVIDGIVDSILVDTAEIGAAGAGLTALATQTSVNTIDDFLDTEVAAILAAVDTEVAAIKAKTDNLPANTGTTLSGIETKIDTVDTVVDAVKVKTDSLTFTVAGQVDSNITYVNDVEVIGDGESGTEWGPAP